MRCCDSGCAVANAGIRLTQTVLSADRGVICGLAREGCVRPRWAAIAMAKMSVPGGGI
jgi:hypothetical protein